MRYPNCVTQETLPTILRRVGDHAKALADARAVEAQRMDRLDQAVLDALDAGATYMAVGAVARLSREGVRLSRRRALNARK